MEKNTTNKFSESLMKIVFLISAVFSILAVISIFVFLLLRGIPAINKIGFFNFIFGKIWNSNSADTYLEPITGKYGISSMIIGSLYATAGAVLIGGTLGIFTAIFLAKFCPGRIKKILSQVINLLAGIPSIIYGFFGMKILLPLLGVFSPNGDGSGILAVSIILGIMILPTVTALSKTSIEAVDKSYFEGSVALGLSKEQSVFKVVVPAAKSGILASVVLGVGRAIGETMAVVMVAGGNTVFPSSLFSSFRTMTANVVMEMSYAGELQMGALIATGVVLFVFILIINLSFAAIMKDRKNKKQGIFKRLFRFFPIFLQKEAKELKEIDSLEYPIYNGSFGRGLNNAGKIFSYITTGIGIFSLASIILFILVSGLPHITPQLLFGTFEYGSAPSIFSSIVSTGMLILLSSVIAFPLGIFTAIYLVEYTKKGSRLVRFIRLAVETLGGIPSIVYGLFGMVFFCNILRMGTSIIAGCLTIAIMVIPTTVRATEEALKAVPESYREGSYALGCGKLKTIYRVVIPSALPGILAAVILGIGRMVAESAPVLFTMGASLKPMPKGYGSSGTTLAVALYALAREGKYVNEAYATACILIFLVLALNILSTLLVGRLQDRLTGKIRKRKSNEQ